MKKYLAIIILILSIACTPNNTEPFKNKEASPNYTWTSNAEPYNLTLHIEHSEDMEYRLVATMTFHNGSYTASPLSNNDFTGLFKIVLDESETLTMDERYEEYPPSVETIDPIEGVPVNWIRENTTYKRVLNIKSQEDFEVSGLISFTIEPLCTFEKIPFVVSFEDGELKISKSS